MQKYIVFDREVFKRELDIEYCEGRDEKVPL